MFPQTCVRMKTYEALKKQENHATTYVQSDVAVCSVAVCKLSREQIISEAQMVG